MGSSSTQNEYCCFPARKTGMDKILQRQFCLESQDSNLHKGHGQCYSLQTPTIFIAWFYILKAKVYYFEFLPSRVFCDKKGVGRRGTQEPNFPPLMPPPLTPWKKHLLRGEKVEREKDGIQVSLCPYLSFLTCQCFFKSKSFCGHIEPWAVWGRLPSLWAMSISNSRRIKHLVLIIFNPENETMSSIPCLLRWISKFPCHFNCLPRALESRKVHCVAPRCTVGA